MEITLNMCFVFKIGFVFTDIMSMKPLMSFLGQKHHLNAVPCITLIMFP